MKEPPKKERKLITYTKQDGTTATRKAPGKRQHKLLDEDNVQLLPCNRNKQYFVWDTRVKGLHVLVNKRGTRTYRSLWYFPGSSKPHSRALGRVGVMPLEEARTMCLTDQKAAKGGFDPTQGQASNSDTFEALVNEYIDREQIARKALVTAEETRRTLLKDCAVFRNRPIAHIRIDEIEDHLEWIRDGDAQQKGRPYLAVKIWGYLGTMFKWAVKKRKLVASPIAAIDMPWDGAKPRDRVFSDEELKKLWHASLEPIEAAYLRMLILTGKRRGALEAMCWGEINERTWMWTPPPGRKNKRVHPIPLPQMAQDILLKLKPEDPKPDDKVFPVTRLALRLQKKVKKVSGIGDFFPHAIRHTVETRLAELRVPPHLRDRLLDHVPSRGAGKGYDHWEYQDEKREAMEKWAAEVKRLTSPVHLVSSKPAS